MFKADFVQHLDLGNSPTGNCLLAFTEAHFFQSLGDAILRVLPSLVVTDWNVVDVQVQLSRIVLYHLKEKGFDREALRTEHLDQEKMEYLYTGKDSGKTHNYGLNFSDMDFLREFTELSYQVMFTGIE